MPTVYTYNFTVQRQLTSKISVSGGYVANSGRHSILGTDRELQHQPAVLYCWRQFLFTGTVPVCRSLWAKIQLWLDLRRE